MWKIEDQSFCCAVSQATSHVAGASTAPLSLSLSNALIPIKHSTKLKKLILENSMFDLLAADFFSPGANGMQIRLFQILDLRTSDADDGKNPFYHLTAAQMLGHCSLREGRNSS
jgi:hypothetical protein